MTDEILMVLFSGVVIAVVLGLTSLFSNKLAKKRVGKRAIEDCSKTIEIDPNNANAYCNRGIAKFELNDHQGAIVDYSKAIDIDSGYADAYSLRGISKLEIGDNGGACLDWKKASELGLDAANELMKKYCN